MVWRASASAALSYDVVTLLTLRERIAQNMAAFRLNLTHVCAHLPTLYLPILHCNVIIIKRMLIRHCVIAADRNMS